MNNQKEYVSNGQVSLGFPYSEEHSELQGKRDSALEAYGYDFVSAVTMKAINYRFVQYFEKAEKKMERSSKYTYIVRTNNKSLVVADKNLSKQFDALDLFNIPPEESKRTTEQSAAWKRACEELQFAYGYYATLATESRGVSIIDYEGLETAVEIKDGSKVIFRPPFEKFIIIENHINEAAKSKMYRYEQGADIWLFGVQICFGINNKTEFNTLPVNIQNQLGNSSTDKFFSIESLFLNTTAIEVKTWPDHFKLGSVDFKYAFNLFLKQLFTKIKDVSGNFTMGYSIQPDISECEKGQYIVYPTDYRYCISPYLDERGQPSKSQKDLYTLNYIAICDKRPFPKLQTLNWNWVDKGKENEFHGVCAIRKSRILNFAQIMIQKHVESTLIVKPTIALKVKRKTGEINLGSELTPNESLSGNKFVKEVSDYKESLVSDVGAKATYTLELKVSANTNEFQKAIIQFTISMKYDFTAKVKSVFNNKGSGRMIDQEIIGKWELSIGNDSPNVGKLIITPTITSTKGITNLDIDDLKLLHVVRGTLETSKIKLSTNFDGYVKNFTDIFQNKFNDQVCSWFIPGGEEAVYSNSSISNGSDFVCDMIFAN